MSETSFANMVAVVAKLRSPSGCPWDREQTLSTLHHCLTEELAEVKQAIDKADHANLREELGDMIFTLLMMVEIAAEKGLFDLESVLAEGTKKMVERHTWVFGSDKVSNAAEALELWQKNKAKNKERANQQ